MRKNTNVKTRKTVEKISKAILMIILISTIMAFCMSGYEKSAIAPNLIKANENSTINSSTAQNSTGSAANGATSGDKPVAIDQSQLQSLDDYISNNQQNPDSETPKEEQTTEDGIQPNEENQEINEQNAEGNASEETTVDDADTNADNGIATYASEISGSDLNLNVSWKSQIKGEYWNKINKIIATSDGGAVAVGWVYQESTNPTITTNGNKDALIIKYDSKGKIEWFKNYGGTDDDEAVDVIQHENTDRLVVIGNACSADLDDVTSSQNPFILLIELDGSIFQEIEGASSNNKTSKNNIYAISDVKQIGDSASSTDYYNDYVYIIGSYTDDVDNITESDTFSVGRR